MRARGYWVLVAVLGISSFVGLYVAEASDPEVSVSFVPFQYTFVDGDRENFRAQHWMNDGYVGGLKDLSVHHTFADGTVFTTESHALIDQNDVGADVSLRNEHLGFLTLDFSEFRKYYDGTGGTYHRFQTLQTNETNKELALDLGKFGLETGVTLEGFPALTLAYEREYKDGAKSRLTWADVTDRSDVTGSNALRKIGPAWQDIDEVVDSFALHANHELAGFTLQGEQRWEFVRTETFREERSLATSGVAADMKIRRQDQAPEANVMTTLLEGSRVFLNDKAFVTSAYRFAHLDNREFESLNEFNADSVPTNFSNPKQQINARADNDYDTHTWVGNLILTPWQGVSVGTKLKSEVIKRDSNSAYPTDAVPNSSGGNTPNGVIDRTDVSLNRTKAIRWGEALSVHLTNLPRTALYTELELEQTRVLLREDRRSLDGPDTGDGSSIGEVFSRETVTDVRRGAWTLGGQVAPWSSLNVTAHVRRRVNNNDYDDQRETAGTGALSAFTDAQNIHTNEFVTRATYRPCRWLRSSFRYQFRGDKYDTRFETQQAVTAAMDSHTYTYDVSLQPRRDLDTTLSFSRQDATTSTPADLGTSTGNLPALNANVNTWLLSAVYTPKPHVTVTNAIQYSRADNFNDFSSTGLPLGADYQQVDVTTGLDWSLDNYTTVGTKYAFYRYHTNADAASGDYNAHTIWLEASKAF